MGVLCVMGRILSLSNEKIRTKYHEPIKQCQRYSWKIEYDPKEVGCRGFAGQSLCRSLANIEIVRTARSKAIKNITNEVLATSKWICLKRSEHWRKKKSMEFILKIFLTNTNHLFEQKGLNPNLVNRWPKKKGKKKQSGGEEKLF